MRAYNTAGHALAVIIIKRHPLPLSLSQYLKLSLLLPLSMSRWLPQRLPAITVILNLTVPGIVAVSVNVTQAVTIIAPILAHTHASALALVPGRAPSSSPASN